MTLDVGDRIIARIGDSYLVCNTYTHRIERYGQLVSRAGTCNCPDSQQKGA